MDSKNKTVKPVDGSAPRLNETPPATLRILVIGGTSGIGRETVTLALERGHTVTAMARRPERIGLTHPKLVTVKGDILEAAAVHEAATDQDAIVIAIGMGLTRQPVTLFSRGTKNVLGSMEAMNTRRLVAVTGIGAGDTREHGGFFYDRIFRPLALQTVYDDKDRQEALIMDRSNSFPLAWTIVRPGVLGNGPAKHRYRVITDLTDISGGKIARSDVAHFIISALESRSHVRETPLLIN